MDKPTAPPPMPGQDAVYRWLYYFWSWVTEGLPAEGLTTNDVLLVDTFQQHIKPYPNLYPVGNYQTVLENRIFGDQ